MRPEVETSGYLFVAELGEEQRQEREIAGSSPFATLEGRNDSQKGKSKSNGRSNSNSKDQYRDPSLRSRMTAKNGRRR